jgi:hypothetical protein
MPTNSTSCPPPLEIGSFARAPRFPATRFTSQQEYQDFLGTEQDRLDARYEYEQSKGTREAHIVQNGTCAPCLRPAVFTSGMEGGERLKDGRHMPNWREAMQCDCRDRLSNRQRALLHFVQAMGVLPWARLLLFGAPEPTDIRLAGMVSEIVTMRPFLASKAVNDIHLAVSYDYLQHVPPLAASLAGLCAMLVEGGSFIFSVPFLHSAASSELMNLASFAGQVPGEIRGKSHKFGWDLLAMLREAGFRDASVYLYWSEELGYLGPANFIFRAMK